MTRTLGYGLNVGNEKSLAEVQVLIFLLRRFIFAICIVLAYDNVALGLSTLLASSMAMLSLLSQQWYLWDDYWISVQHLVNELFLSILCLALIVLSNAYILPYTTVDASTEVFITLLVLFILFNAAVLIYDLCKFLRLHLLRMRAIIDHRRTRYTIMQVNKVTEEAQAHLLRLAADGQFARKHLENSEQVRLAHEKAKAKRERHEARLRKREARLAAK